MEELRSDGTVSWFQCTRVNVDRDGATGIAYITEDSDPMAAFDYAQTASPGYNENVAVLWRVVGGGVVYFPIEFDWPMFDDGPYPDDLEVIDPECAPFPEPNPEFCPLSPAAGSSNAGETSTGLTEISAWLACRSYGDSIFRYGWDPHNVFGMITHQVVNDHWFFKLEADVTNEYGAEAAVVVECTVSGTDARPAVDSFILY